MRPVSLRHLSRGTPRVALSPSISSRACRAYPSACLTKLWIQPTGYGPHLEWCSPESKASPHRGNLVPGLFGLPRSSCGHRLTCHKHAFPSGTAGPRIPKLETAFESRYTRRQLSWRLWSERCPAQHSTLHATGPGEGGVQRRPYLTELAGRGARGS